MTMNIKDVTLYQSGVGFFHANCPEDQFVLPVNEKDINDVLKSLSVNGLKSVRFSSSEELARVLQKIGINIESDAALLSICSHLIGLEVEVKTDKDYTGIVMGIDEISDDTIKAVSKGQITNEVLVIKIDDEIKTFPLQEITDIKLKDPIIQKDVNSYLDLIANKRKAGVVNLYIEAKTDTWATWVMPVSSWRLSYRAFYNKEKKELDLFGISIIDNTTSIDWENVVLRIVTGKPISFRYDLYNPLFINRPEIIRDVKGVAPMMSEAAGVFDDFEGSYESEETISMKGYTQDLPDAAPSVGLGAMSRSAMAMAPRAKPMAAPPPSPQKQITPKVEAVKLEIGSAIAYEVNYPVTINRSQSALIPILNEKLKGELCVILRDDRLSEPMDAIMLTKPLELEKGAATIYLDGSYAGDSMIIGGTEFIAFRLNQDLSIMKEREEKFTTEEIAIEGMQLAVKKSSTVNYTFKIINRSKEIIPCYLESLKMYNYGSIEKPDAETNSYYRYNLQLKPGNSVKKLSYIKTYYEYIAIINLTESQLEDFLQKGYISNINKKKISNLLTIYATLKQKQQALMNIEKEIKHQFDNQKRIRDNIVVIKDDENLKKDYLQKLKASETQLERLLRDQNTTKAEIDEIQQKFENASD
ncbi:MAG: hypothetical protein JXA54_16250 [Candidatus Heimdallarchaeota archaeon]|nr:hypothetical protein [Candidatus Heimdallarchaeota archaeon]